MGWLGTFIDDSTLGPAFDVWPGVGATGKTGGPTAIFDLSSNTASGDTLVLSASSQFMSHVLTKSNDGSSGNPPSFLMAGLLGTVEEVPAGFTTSTIIYHGKHGVNDAVTAFGDAMRVRCVLLSNPFQRLRRAL